MYRNNSSIQSDLNRHFSRYEDPLWDDVEEKPPTIYRVERVDKSRKTIIKVIENNEILYIIDCEKLNKRQANFIKSQEGMSFVIQQLKVGVKNISNLKKALSNLKIEK